MRPASGWEQAGAFAVNAGTGYAGALASIPAGIIDASIDSVAGMTGQRPIGAAPKMPVSEAVGDTRRATADWIKELLGIPKEAITDTADAFGTAGGEVAAMKAKVPKWMRETGAGLLERSATKQYTKALAPSKANRALADEVVPELVKRGEAFSDPRAFATKMSDAADAVPVDDAVRNMPQAVQTRPILNELNTQRQALFNEVGRVPKPHSPEMTEKAIHALKRKHRGAEIVEENGELVARKIRYPDMQEKASRLSKLKNHVEGASGKSGLLKNEQALNLRKDADYFSDPTGKYFDQADNIESVRKPADAHLAEALRKQINADPTVGPLNLEKNFLLKAQRLAEGAPPPKEILTGTQPIVAGLGFLLGGKAGAGVMAGGNALWRIIQHPAYRTASAVTKKRVADLVRQGNTPAAIQLAGSVIQEAEQMDNE